MAIVGQKITLEATFRDSADALVDPTTVRIHHEVPAGTKTTYVFGVDPEVTKESTGVYRYSILTNSNALKGIHIYRWDDNGENAIADGKIIVEASTFI